MNPKVRIKDIAELAGVSEGTVDRVLHHRGDVSEKSRLAVTKVLEEMNYTPNLFARSLASKKQYRFVCLFPRFQPGDYWESVDKGLELAAKDFIHHNVRIDKYCFDQYDVNSFIIASESILENEPDAIIVAPIFRDETFKFTSQLSKRNIPFSYIDSLIEDTDYLTYYGQNSFQSGYIAAKLILNSLATQSQVVVIRTKRKGAVSNQTIARYNGFMHYIKENQLDECIELINVELTDDEEDENLNIFKDVFSLHSNIKATITFNSKAYRLAMYLRSLNRTDVKLIGYDLVALNVAFLQEDVISYLIAQRPDKQAYFSVRDMCRELIFKQEIKKINYVPIDILIKENIEDYICFKE